MPVDLATLNDDGLENLVDNYRRNNATGEKTYSDAITELARREGKGLDFDTTMRVVRDAARRGRFISYGEVAAASGAQWSTVRHAIGSHLDRLIEYCHLHGLPLLSAIVVNKTNLATGALDPDSLKGFVAGVRGVGIPVQDELSFLQESQRAVFEWARTTGDAALEGLPSARSDATSDHRPAAIGGNGGGDEESSSADRVRAFLTRRYVQPARTKGQSEITIRAGEVHKEIGLDNRMPAVCSVLDGKLFREENGLELIERSGPSQGATATFRFGLNKNDSNAAPGPRPAAGSTQSISSPGEKYMFGGELDGDQEILSAAERSLCSAIQRKDGVLRSFLESSRLSDKMDAAQWLRYLTGIKHALGNLNNDLGFVATLLVKGYLQRRFGISDFDAAGKPQGAAGADVQAKTPDGKIIVGEIKTTTPYQPGFGAAQRTTILKDLARLAASPADYRLMFVVDPDAYRALCGVTFSAKAPGVELVDLVSSQTCVFGATE